MAIIITLHRDGERGYYVAGGRIRIRPSVDSYRGPWEISPDYQQSRDEIYKVAEAIESFGVVWPRLSDVRDVLSLILARLALLDQCECMRESDPLGGPDKVLTHSSDCPLGPFAGEIDTLGQKREPEET